MSDTRTVVEKLRAMAGQDVSPNEAAIAREKLADTADRMPPPRPPTAVGAAPMPEWSWTSTSTNGNSGFTVTWTVNL